MSAAVTTVALVAHDIHDRGGMERAFRELVVRAPPHVRFVVVASTLSPELEAHAEWRRVPAPRRPMPLKMIVFAVLGGVRLRRVRADLVHTLGAIVPNRADVTTVQYCHAGHVELTGRLSPEGMPVLRRANTALKRILALAGERWCYRPARLRVLAAVSRGVAREVERHYPGVRVAITPNGVDVERFHPDAEARAALRRELDLADETFVALFVGGDWERKGLDVAIEGMAAAGVAGAELWVVGRGDSRRFDQLAGARGVRVRFFGARDDAERFLQAADVFVLPTLYETFSLVAYEAAASEVPVVATRVSGIDELLDGDGAGVVVERDAAEVGAALARLAADSGLRRALGAAGRRRASAFTWERSVDSVFDLYGTLRERP